MYLFKITMQVLNGSCLFLTGLLRLPCSVCEGVVSFCSRAWGPSLLCKCNNDRFRKHLPTRISICWRLIEENVLLLTHFSSVLVSSVFPVSYFCLLKQGCKGTHFINLGQRKMGSLLIYITWHCLVVRIKYSPTIADVD